MHIFPINIIYVLFIIIINIIYVIFITSETFSL